MGKKRSEDVLIRMLYIFKAPVVHHPPNDGTIIPTPLREKILPSRIEAVVNGDFDRELCSIADLVAYLYTASLKFPITKEYVMIYSYYADKLFDGKLSTVLDFIPEKLPAFYEDIATSLRRRIFKVQMRAIRKLIQEVRRYA